jgi:putative endonuclease
VANRWPIVAIDDRVVRTSAQQLGDAAEALVASRLAESGWTIHARNVRIGRHELDIIATDPGPPPTLVFVEVRWRARRDFGLAEETVDRRKRAHLRTAALRLLSGPDREAHLPRLPIRFDLVVVEPGDRIRHHRHGA